MIKPLEIISLALKELPGKMDSDPARIMLMAIGLQESRFAYRRQMGNGPARGFWQFEAGGGVRGVMEHSASRQYAYDALAARGLAPVIRTAWAELEHDDVLAAIFARLLLWTDRHALPHNWQGGWDCYIRNWRPGKPHPGTWREHYESAERQIWY